MLCPDGSIRVCFWHRIRAAPARFDPVPASAHERVPEIKASTALYIRQYACLSLQCALYIRQLCCQYPPSQSRLAHKRKALGLSQTALAKKAHVGRSTLDALENGRMGELGIHQDQQHSFRAGP